jgi:hypothetical protein
MYTKKFLLTLFNVSIFEIPISLENISETIRSLLVNQDLSFSGYTILQYIFLIYKDNQINQTRPSGV